MRYLGALVGFGALLGRPAVLWGRLEVGRGRLWGPLKPTQALLDRLGGLLGPFVAVLALSGIWKSHAIRPRKSRERPQRHAAGPREIRELGPWALERNIRY